MLSELAVDLGKRSLDPDADLLEQGIIDSLGVMKLVLVIEESYGIEVNDQDIIPKNFQCLSVYIGGDGNPSASGKAKFCEMVDMILSQ